MAGVSSCLILDVGRRRGVGIIIMFDDVDVVDDGDDGGGGYDDGNAMRYSDIIIQRSTSWSRF